MKTIIICYSILALSFLGCKIVPKGKKQTKNNSLKIEHFLSEKQLKIVNKHTSIELYKIQKKHIEGTKNEYSNKTVFVKKLNKKEEKSFLNYFLNDSSYLWKKKITGTFDPSQQFIIKSKKQQFLVLFSDKNKELSIIDLEGQRSLMTTFEKIKL